MKHKHFHTGEGMVWWVPAKATIQPQLKTIDFSLDSMKDLVGGWIEIVRTPHLPELDCGCRVVMVVNEDGHASELAPNAFGTLMYPGHHVIVGNIFLVAEGPVKRPDSPTEIDLFGLPQSFNTWMKFVDRLGQ